MQKKGYSGRKLILLILILLLSEIVLLTGGCRDSGTYVKGYHSGSGGTKARDSDGYPVDVRYRSFQNSDSTWGYTIFLNSRPYMHFSGIPVKRGESVIKSKEEAEIVAGMLVKKIKEGDYTPKLDKKVLDSIEQKIIMND